jgi:hypothetical protein
LTVHPTQNPSTAPKAPRSRTSRNVRRAAIALLALIAITLGVLTQSPLTTSYILPKLAKFLPGDLKADSVRLGIDGRLRVNGIRLSLPSQSGPSQSGDASTFFEAQQLKIGLDWSSLADPEPKVTSLVLVAPRIRLSQSTDDQTLNIAQLEMPKLAGGSPAAAPRVRVERGVIEIGEHNTRGYSKLKEVFVSGELNPSAEQDGSYALRVEELRPADLGTGSGTPAPGMTVEGVVGPKRGQLLLSRVSLDDWPPQSVPAPIRDALSRLELRGKITRAKLSYAQDTPLSASVDLDRVGVTLPITGEEASIPGDATTQPTPPHDNHNLRLEQVTGQVTLTGRQIEADLNGMLEDLPYRVRLRFEDTAPDAAFVCELSSEGFEVRQHPQILRFAPKVAKERVAQFCNPTGIVDAWIRVSRAAPSNGVPGNISVRGSLKLRDTVAAFDKFPYQWSDMEGTILFDDNAIEFRDIKGRSASGATVRASGIVSPPSETSEVNVEVIVTGAPIDEALLEAMGPARRKVLDTLMNKPAFDELVAAGLLTRAQSVADVVTLPPPPLGEPAPFAIGGTADIRVNVHRQLGEVSVWTDRVEVILPAAGIIPEQFRYPILGTDVRIVVLGGKADVTSGNFRGLRGGNADLTASVRLAKREATDGQAMPEVNASASGIVIDDLLIHALPDSPLAGLSGESRTVREMLHALGLQGTIAATARVFDGGDGNSGYEVSIRPEQASATPTLHDGPVGFSLSALAGTIDIDRNRIAANLQSPLTRLPAANATADSLGSLSLKLLSGFSAAADAPASGTTIEAKLSSAAADAPYPRAAALFSADAAASLTDNLTTLDPKGRADATLTFRTGAAGNEQSIVLQNLSGLEFNLGSSRLTVLDSIGKVRLDRDQITRVEFDSFKATLGERDAPIGSLLLQGTAQRADSWLVGSEGLRINVTGLQIGSDTARAELEQRLGDEARDLYRQFAPAGTLDGDVALEQGPDGINFHGSIRPQSISITRRGSRVQFPTAQGQIDFSRAGGTLRGLTLNAPSWSLAADGAWTFQPNSWTVDRLETTYTLDSKGIPPDLRAALPESLDQVLTELDLSHADRIAVSAGRLALSRPADQTQGHLLTTGGTLELTNATFNVGLQISECTGKMIFDVSRPPDGNVKFTIDSDYDSLRMAGVRVTAAHVDVRSGDTPGHVLVPLITADCHGGRLAGEASISPAPPDAPASPTTYDARLRFSGVRFGPVLADLRDEDDQTKAPAEDPNERGFLSAEVTLTGEIGNIDSRRGRGMAEIGGGKVLSMPVLLALVRASNLQLPVGEKIRLGRSTFFIEGPVVAFEDISFFAENVEILGYGTLTWPATSLDMRFDSRSLRRIPVLSGLIEGIRDQFVSTAVDGTIDEPNVSVAGLSGPRRLFSKIFGSQSDQDRRMEDIRRRAAAERARAFDNP